MCLSLDPPEMNTNQLLLVSTLGLIINLFGMLAMGGHAHHGHSHGHGHGHGHAHHHDDDDAHDHVHCHNHPHGPDSEHEHDHTHDHVGVGPFTRVYLIKDCLGCYRLRQLWNTQLIRVTTMNAKATNTNVEIFKPRLMYILTTVRTRRPTTPRP